MISIILGLSAALFGLWLTWLFHSAFWFVLKGILPPSLFFAGLIATVSGISSLLSKRQDKPDKKGHEKT